MVSILLCCVHGGMAVVCCCCWSTSVWWCSPRLAYPSAVLISTAVVSCTVHCLVRGVVRVTICPWCSCGGVPSVRLPPHSGGGWGCRGWWGGMAMWGGIAMEGRWCQWLPLLLLLSSPSVCWCPRLVCLVAVLNGGGVCCDAPSSDWSGTLCCPVSLFRIVLPCLLWVGKCGGVLSMTVVCGVCRE